jgi:Tol biopolymer transport system component
LNRTRVVAPATTALVLEAAIEVGHVPDLFRSLRQPRRLSTGIGSDPSWSPDSSRIVYGGYDANVEPDLWMVNADGSHDADLTNTPSVEESRPDWSPDGSSLTYLSYSELQAGLFVATVSGGDAHLVAATGQSCCGAPDWSPDGTQIAFDSTQ